MYRGNLIRLKSFVKVHSCFKQLCQSFHFGKVVHHLIYSDFYCVIPSSANKKAYSLALSFKALNLPEAPPWPASILVYRTIYFFLFSSHAVWQPIWPVQNIAPGYRASRLLPAYLDMPVWLHYRMANKISCTYNFLYLPDCPIHRIHLLLRE